MAVLSAPPSSRVLLLAPLRWGTDFSAGRAHARWTGTFGKSHLEVGHGRGKWTHNPLRIVALYALRASAMLAGIRDAVREGRWAEAALACQMLHLGQLTSVEGRPRVLP